MVVAFPNNPVLDVLYASSGAVVELEELDEELELPEELEPPLELEPPELDEPPLDDELPPLDEEPPEELPEELDVSAARYITERTSISIWRRIDRASNARSTCSWPVDEYWKYRLSPA
jgi:hypothetical protein